VNVNTKIMWHLLRWLATTRRQVLKSRMQHGH